MRKHSKRSKGANFILKQLKLMKKYRKWTCFVVYASPKKQIKIIEKLLHSIRAFDHYNFNTYDDHVSIRVCGSGKKLFAEKLEELGYSWKEQPYDYEGKRSYELGTRLTLLYMVDKKYYDGDHEGNGIDLVEVIHGFLDDMGISEKSEANLHRKMWWHFAVKKPYWRLKKRLRCLVKK